MLLRVPETRGRSLEEMEAYFEQAHVHAHMHRTREGYLHVHVPVHVHVHVRPHPRQARTHPGPANPPILLITGLSLVQLAGERSYLNPLLKK